MRGAAASRRRASPMPHPGNLGDPATGVHLRLLRVDSARAHLRKRHELRSSRTTTGADGSDETPLQDVPVDLGSSCGAPAGIAPEVDGSPFFKGSRGAFPTIASSSMMSIDEGSVSLLREFVWRVGAGAPPGPRNPSRRRHGLARRGGSRDWMLLGGWTARGSRARRPGGSRRDPGGLRVPLGAERAGRVSRGPPEMESGQARTARAPRGHAVAALPRLGSAGRLPKKRRRDLRRGAAATRGRALRAQGSEAFSDDPRRSSRAFVARAGFGTGPPKRSRSPADAAVELGARADGVGGEARAFPDEPRGPRVADVRGIRGPRPLGRWSRARACGATYHLSCARAEVTRVRSGSNGPRTARNAPRRDGHRASSCILGAALDRPGTPAGQAGPSDGDRAARIGPIRGARD